MTGGKDLSSVEVYHPGTNTSCSLPSLPEEIFWHSQDGLVLCGGYPNTGRSCYTLNTDTAQWTKTHSLSEKRYQHKSSRREDGSILLIGGYYSKTTTELVSDSSGVSTPGFTLKYETKWVVLCLYCYLSLDKAGLEVKSSHYKQTYTWYPVDTDMAIMTIITVMPAVSQTPPALSSLEEGIGKVQPPKCQDTTRMAGWRTYLHSSQPDGVTAVLSTLQTLEIRY